MHGICPNSMSMACTKELLTVPAQGVPKRLNTRFAAEILRGSPKTNQMNTDRKEGKSRREMGSNLFRRMTRARFASLLGTKNAPSDDTHYNRLPEVPEVVHDIGKDMEPKRRGLLVGITYTNPWNTWSQLDGPHEDVDRYRDLLIST
jgi:hypothetical protein